MSAIVSVIIVTHNSAEYVSACLDSLRSQIYECFEVIVYDNASTDETRTLIRDCYPEVEFIEGRENIGFAAANNRAAGLARGDFLAFLNPDTMVEPDWLLPLIDTLESDQTVGAVTPTLSFAETPDIVNTCGNEVHLSGMTYCRGLGMPAGGGAPIEVGAVSGAAFVIRRKLFEQVGGFEAKFFMYFEDTDLSLRLRCAGFRCLAVPESKVRHAYKAVFGTDKLYYLERNRFLSLLSLMSWRLLMFMLPSLLLIEFATWGYCVMRGRQALAAKARAWRDVIRDILWVRDRRRRYVSRCVNHAFVLRAFSSRLKIQYVGAGGSVLFRGLEIAGWVTAVPALGLAHLLGW
jgi:GT2 family glycosyltransferase